MKKVFNFIWIFSVTLIIQFYTKIVYGKGHPWENAITLYGARFQPYNVRRLFYLSSLVSIFVLFILSVKGYLARKKIKVGDKIKITFVKGKDTITKTCKLMVYSKKKIVFEDKEYQYERTPKEIIKIQKVNTPFKILKILIVVFLILFIADCTVNYILTTSSKSSGDFVSVDEVNFDDFN